jgi:hypothetical protein
MPRRVIGVIGDSWFRFRQFIASHEMVMWAFVAGMSITPIPPPWCTDTRRALEFRAVPEPAAEPGSPPPPGHPEMLVPDVAPTPVERVLWARLGEKLRP